MARRNFAQILKEANVDIRREYDRLYANFYLHEVYNVAGRLQSLREYCGSQFGRFPFRGTCVNLDDFDDFYGFHFEKDPENFDLDYLVSFCEYSYNLAVHSAPPNCFLPSYPTFIDQQPAFFVDQVTRVVDTIGYVITQESPAANCIIIVPKDPAAIAVAEISEEKIAYKIVEYNHYSMKGDLVRKLSTLKLLADEIEPRRKELKGISGSVESELFRMMDKFVRHNNKDNAFIAAMSPNEIESTYDDIYQMWLLAMLELDNVDRKKRAKELLGKINA